jgi:acyl-coenzyme A thioesterase PaaI-like protein
MDAATLQAIFEGLAADYTRRLGLRVATVAPGKVTLTLPVTPELVHAGGVLCEQASWHGFGYRDAAGDDRAVG